MNQVALVGNITDDPELRYTQSGAALANFSLAVSHRRWVPSSVDPSGRATSTARAEGQKGNGSSRAASQPSVSEDRRRSDEKHNGEWQDVTDGLRPPSIGSYGLRSRRRKSQGGSVESVEPIQQPDEHNHEDDR